MAAYLVLLFPAILSLTVSLSESSLPPPQIDARSSHVDQHNNGLISELHQFKIKIAQLALFDGANMLLEAALEESVKNSNAKSLYLHDREKLIDEMGQKILDLQSAMVDSKSDSSEAEDRLNALEQEVQHLWAALRKNNFDFHVLESKTQAAENSLEVMRAKVQKMNDVVTERWIQIRHLEQALQETEALALKAQRLEGSRSYKFSKNFFDSMGIEMRDLYFFGKWSTFSSYESQTYHQLKRIFLAAKKYHHQLQGIIKREIEIHEFPAALANTEIVFFVASALIIFPVISALMFLSSQFN